MKTKVIFLIMGFLTYQYILFANETICFTWKGNTGSKTFSIMSTKGELFYIDWGDDSDIEIKTGKGYDSILTISHTYADTNNYTVSIAGATDACSFMFLDCSICQLTDLDLSKCTTLEILHCYGNYQLTYLNLNTNMSLWRLACPGNSLTVLNTEMDTAIKVLYCYHNQLTNLNLNANAELESLHCYDNQLTSLDLDVNTNLKEISCFNNRLQLLDLYKVSEMISDSSNKRLGQQRLAPQEITKGGSVDYSAQKEFGGSITDFYVERNGNPALTSDYSIDNGIITFNNAGNYRVIMTNPAIVSHKKFPAQVIAELHVVL